MKAINFSLASVLAFTLVSCDGHRGPRVPDVPYMKNTAVQPSIPAASPRQGEPAGLNDQQLLPPMGAATAPSAPPIPPPTKSSLPSPSINLNSNPLPPVPKPAVSPSVPVPSVPSSSLAPLPPTKPTPAPSSALLDSAIPSATSVPVAKAVPNDPHRVFNPWNPAQKIRITNPKTNMPFPSGKTLGIPGTTKKFIVP